MDSSTLTTVLVRVDTLTVAFWFNPALPSVASCLIDACRDQFGDGRLVRNPGEGFRWVRTRCVIAS